MLASKNLEGLLKVYSWLCLLVACVAARHHSL